MWTCNIPKIMRFFNAMYVVCGETRVFMLLLLLRLLSLLMIVLVAAVHRIFCFLSKQNITMCNRMCSLYWNCTFSDQMWCVSAWIRYWNHNFCLAILFNFPNSFHLIAHFFPINCTAHSERENHPSQSYFIWDNSCIVCVHNDSQSMQNWNYWRVSKRK